jgi:hypothetical protein
VEQKTGGLSGSGIHPDMPGDGCLEIPACMVVVFRMSAPGAYKAFGPLYLKQMFPERLFIAECFLEL